MKQTMIERRNEQRRRQALWASERQTRRRVPKIVGFDIVSHGTGNVVGHAHDAEEVLVRAEDYKQNPELEFVAIDEGGHEQGSWSLSEVLDGTFMAHLSVVQDRP